MVSPPLAPLPGGTADPDPEQPPLADQIAAFCQRYRGQVAHLTAAEVVAALEELAALAAALPPPPPQEGGAWQEAEEILAWLERRLHLQAPLLFFLVELQALPRERLAAYCSEARGLPLRGFLLRLLREQGHQQPEPLERCFYYHQLTGRFAWRQLWHALLHVPERHSLKGEGEPTHTLGDLWRLQTHASAEIRLAAYQRLHQHLETHAESCGFILSRLIQDQLWEAQWRGYDSPLELYLARHGLPQTVFENLIESIRDRVDLFQRYYRLKSRETGRSIRICDLQAPWDLPAGMAEQPLGSAEAAALVLAALQEFCPECAAQAKPWLARETSPPSAPSSTAAVGAPLGLQILLDSIGRLGQQLRPADPVVWPDLEDSAAEATPDLLTQVHREFLQLLVLEYWLHPGRGGRTGSREERQWGSGAHVPLAHAFLIHSLETQLQSVFCQSLITRLEVMLYRQGIPALEEKGHSYAEGVSEEWLKLYQELCGDAVELLPEHQFNWVGIPALFQRPLRAYQASLASLLALGWYRRYHLAPREFLPRYLHWLASPPGSLTLEETALLLQVEMTDPDFFLQTLEELESWIETLEELLEEGPV